jgi:hypothetical protein
MMDGTHFSSNDLNLAREKVRGGNTEHKFEFTLQGKRLLRRFFNRDRNGRTTTDRINPAHEYLKFTLLCQGSFYDKGIEHLKILKKYSFIVTFT